MPWSNFHMNRQNIRCDTFTAHKYNELMNSYCNAHVKCNIAWKILNYDILLFDWIAKKILRFVSQLTLSHYIAISLHIFVHTTHIDFLSRSTRFHFDSFNAFILWQWVNNILCSYRIFVSFTMKRRKKINNNTVLPQCHHYNLLFSSFFCFNFCFWLCFTSSNW